MPSLSAGTTAPDFDLQTMTGQQFSLVEARAQGPVLAVFFKVSCPTCQYALPFLERLHKANEGSRIAVVGVSQNEKKDTAAFIKQFKLTFPLLLDNTTDYPVSNAYGITNVPSVFWIAQDGRIELASVGWVRKEMEELNRLAAEDSGADLVPLFRPDEQIADFRAG